jgi:glycosyltransferase involved in cell wall biosynthesis
MTQFATQRFAPNWQWASDQLSYANTVFFDEWLARRIPNCGADALIALAGAGLKTGRRLQERGGIFICDRGSTHLRVQERLMKEEFSHWGATPPTNAPLHALYEREVEIYGAADFITVPSAFAARSFIESGIAKEKVHVIPYGVRLEKFRQVAEPASDRFEVLFVGQVGLRKGVPYLLQAFAGLRHPHKRLRIVGSIRPEIKQVLAHLPKDKVEFLGPQPQAEVVRYMSSSHVMILPSIEEGLALVQAQALACGCPVIATTNTGGEDLFHDGVEGYIVPIRDVAAIQERMQWLADNAELQRAMSAAALKLVSCIGGWRQYGERWVRLLQTLVRT